MLSPGTLLSDRYLLNRRIASGGMGEVWSSDDVLLERQVAVKALLPELISDADFITRFRTEARLMAALRHPGIVQVHDYGENKVVDGSRLDYLVMELIEGQPLSKRIKAAGKLDVAETLSIVTQAADALHVAHQAGIVHRDVKPSNLLIRPDGAVVLIDFGVARSSAVTSVTSHHVIVGSPMYMPPEQATGGPLSAATDIYALGAVAYCCLTGKPPFTGENPVQVIAQLLHGEPVSMPAEIPAVVSSLVSRALDRDPAKRHPTAAAFAEAARAAQASLGGTPAPAPRAALVPPFAGAMGAAPTSAPPAEGAAADLPTPAFPASGPPAAAGLPGAAGPGAPFAAGALPAAGGLPPASAPPARANAPASGPPVSGGPQLNPVAQGWPAAPPLGPAYPLGSALPPPPKPAGARPAAPADANRSTRGLNVALAGIATTVVIGLVAVLAVLAMHSRSDPSEAAQASTNRENDSVAGAGSQVSSSAHPTSKSAVPSAASTLEPGKSAPSAAAPKPAKTTGGAPTSDAPDESDPTPAAPATTPAQAPPAQAPAPAAPSSCPHGYVCFWTGANYSGDMGKLFGKNADWTTFKHAGCPGGTWAGCAASVYNNGDNCKAQLWTKANFQSAALLVTRQSGVPQLDGTFNHQIRSNDWIC